MAAEPESFKVVYEVENHDGGHLICLFRVWLTWQLKDAKKAAKPGPCDAILRGDWTRSRLVGMG